MTRALRALFGGVLIVYLSGCGLLYFYQRSLIYFPTSGSPNVGETITLPVASERILVSTRPLDSPRALIYFGGNAEAVSLNLSELSVAFPDRAIYLLHYRGYGGSSGVASEQALFADALTLFDEVHSKHPSIEIIGRSLGSGIAVYVASMRPVERLVLVTPFDSLLELAALQYPYIPVSWLLEDKYESWKYAPQVTAPTLIIAAEHDEIVPRASTEQLRSRFKVAPRFKVIPRTGHNTISSRPEYLQLLKASQ